MGRFLMWFFRYNGALDLAVGLEVFGAAQHPGFDNAVIGAELFEHIKAVYQRAAVL